MASKANNDDRVKIERFDRTLRVTLSDEEVAERANAAATTLQRRDEEEAALAADNKLRKAKIGEMDAEIRRLSTEVREKATYRPVPCERRHEYRTGTVREIRTDTYETIGERAMLDHERQQELGLSKRDAHDDTEPEYLPDDPPEDDAADGADDSTDGGVQLDDPPPGMQAVKRRARKTPRPRS